MKKKDNEEKTSEQSTTSTDNEVIEITSSIEEVIPEQIIEEHKESNTESKALVIKSDVTQIGAYKEILQNLNSLQLFAEQIVKSKLIPSITKVEEVITTVLLAKELDIPPMSALKLHDKLNDKAVLSIYKGKELGLNWLSSIENVHIIETKRGRITQVGYHIINAIIQKANIHFEQIVDFVPLYKYTDSSGTLHDEKNILMTPNKYKIIAKGSLSPDECNEIEAKERVKVVINTGIVYTVGTIYEFTKYRVGSKQPLIIRIGYTLEEAQIAGLYGIPNSKGVLQNGKDNWNSHPGIHCRKMVFTLAGRLLVPEKLNNIYIAEELNIL